MDDKVLKLIDRAINEGLSYGEVESIMAFNGYDQLSIDQALSDIKKKRPEFVRMFLLLRSKWILGHSMFLRQIWNQPIHPIRN